MKKINKYLYVLVLIIFLIGLISINFLFKQMDSKIKPIEIYNNNVKIMNNVYNVDDIIDVKLLDNVSLSGGSGSNTPNTNNGKYKVNGEKFESKVYIHKNISPYIKIELKDKVIVCNQNTSEETEKIYNELIQLTK